MSTSNFSQYQVVRWCALLLASVFLFSCATTQDQYPTPSSRVALVIGNADYPSPSVHSLNNPVRDARDMAQVLTEKLGFDVIHVENADQQAMLTAFRDFGQRLKAAPRGEEKVGLFYYSGHGAQYNGTSVLLSVDTKVTGEFAAGRDGIVPLTSLFKEVNKVADTTANIFIIDACRDNPLIAKNDAGYGLTKSIKGLAWSEDEEDKAYQDISDPNNSLIAYATARGKVADDGYGGDNSPYTKYLLEHIAKPGLSANKLFQKVGKQVKQDTSSKQQPWQYGTLDKDFYFFGKNWNPKTKDIW